MFQIKPSELNVICTLYANNISWDYAPFFENDTYWAELPVKLTDMD
jgi:hypothetical protein